MQLKLALLTTAAMFAMGGSALAQSLPPAADPAVENDIVLNGRVTAQCAIEGANSATITQSLAGDDGFISPTAAADIISALNQAQPEAWCSGDNNQMNLYRTMLVRNGSNGQPDDGFAQAVLFDAGINFPTPVNNGFSYDEGTSDGEGSGPVVGRFGPTGNGETGVFVIDNYDGGATAFTTAEAGNADPSDTGPSATFVETPGVRLAAGDYTSTVTLRLTPGV